MTREITHMKAFMAALDSMGKDPLAIGKIPPTPGLVDQFYNDSTGEGDDGEIDARGRGMKATTGNSSKPRHSTAVSSWAKSQGSGEFRPGKKANIKIMHA